MATVLDRKVLSEAVFPADGAALWVKRALLVAAGIAAMAVAAKLRIPFWPVPATMQTFVVLSVGAAFGVRLGLATMLGYLLIGALGFDVFTSSSAENKGLAYMMGGTGGYLVGFVLATAFLGWAARAGWDRSVGRMALAMLAGNAIIYIPGVAWLAHLYVSDKGWAWVMEWGLTNFVLFDVLKLALAAVLFPALWKLVGRARS